jgi:hypothetical protein
VHRLHLILSGVVLAFVLALSARAETFTLNDGTTVTGEILTNSISQRGILFKLPDGKYSEPVAWTKFSQDDLKKLEEMLPKAVPFIEPLIEVTIEEKRAKTAIEVKTDFPKLERPKSGSLIGGLLSSPLGIVIILLIYAANIYAGYEVAIFRAQPPALVCGIAAVLPIVGPIIFLSMPTRVQKVEDEWAGVEGEAHDEVVKYEVTGETPSEETMEAQQQAAAAAATGLPPTQVFPRGQFTLNRRFFETKFAGFFGVIKRAEKDLVLVVKTARGTYVADRIPRIAANDIHFLIVKGNASEEVTIPFTEIQEVQLKHKDAP